ncbi:Mov34/MPN/PAD-1 family protein [Ktedonobacteria bacterium brp13]|nr:Mov34/MPN/PAD-1 family protein [Ktedonobacteria bacterium brp13]
MTREEFSGDRLTFARVSAGCLQISPSALAVMRLYVQDASEKAEAGGILLGRHILGTNDIIVDGLTTPMPGDRRSRFQFFRARRRHQEVIDRAWQESSGTCTYLGEWHTHPELCPIPSRIDRLHWQQKLFRDQFDEPIFFIIIGISKVCVWEGYRNRRLMPLQLL